MWYLPIDQSAKQACCMRSDTLLCDSYGETGSSSCWWKLLLRTQDDVFAAVTCLDRVYLKAVNGEMAVPISDFKWFAHKVL